jgi:hypothetical protein
MKFILFSLMIASAVRCFAQQAATDTAMVKFFSGNWSCAGEFGNGRVPQVSLVLRDLGGPPRSSLVTDSPCLIFLLSL